MKKGINKKRICYFAASNMIYGGNQSLIVLLKNLDKGRFDPLVVVPSKGPLTKELSKFKIDHKIWKIHEKDDIKKYSSDILKCVNFFNKNQIDLIHFNFSTYWKPAEIIAAIISNIPVINHVRFIGGANTPYVRFSDVTIANSEFTSNLLPLPKEKIKTVYDGIDLKRFENAGDLRTEFNFGKNDILISFIGMIKMGKGINIFLDLANLLKNNKTKFLIVGNLKDEKDSQMIKKKISENNRIIYVGYREDIENVYTSSDIIIMPTLYKETFGRVAAEAGAAGKPIITTKLGALPEIVKHGYNGYLFEKGDMDSLMKYARNLIKDKKLRKKMGRKGKKIVKKKFNIKEHIKQIEKIYGDLL